MLRKVIQIDEEKCTGCRLCVDACHEGAIGLVDGKAKLLRDDFCDGMGDCLPSCPAGAISFVEREALPYDEAAVAAATEARKLAQGQTANGAGATGAQASAGTASVADATGDQAPAAANPTTHHGGCPGSRAQVLHAADTAAAANAANAAAADEAPSALGQWPCQIKLMPLQSPYYQGADLLIAADCTAFAYASFHERYMRGKITVIGCPKLDAIDYSEKLATIIALNDIKSITMCRMEVPCCGGLERAAANALAASGKDLPFEVVTFSVRGEVL